MKGGERVSGWVGEGVTDSRTHTPTHAQVASALAQAYEALGGIDDGRLTAQALLAHVLGVPRAHLLAHPERNLTLQEHTEYMALVARAARGEALAYLTGEREFCGLSFWVDGRVLVPRPETEQLVELALAARPADGRRWLLLDVGTGSGCLAVTLAVRAAEAAWEVEVTATDISAEALEVARRNAQRHGVEARIKFIQGDLLAGVLPPPRFDLVCANLPYIDSGELQQLDVFKHEPRQALDGGPGGLALIERLLAQAPAVLASGGCLLLEIGATQGQAAAGLARRAFPQGDVRVYPDLSGLDRVVVARA